MIGVAKFVGAETGSKAITHHVEDIEITSWSQCSLAVRFR